MASDGQVMPLWRNAPHRFVLICVSAVSVRKVGKAMKACTSNMFNILASFTKRNRKSKTSMWYLPSILWFFMGSFRFLI